jgi:hypothetical protein
MKVKIKFKNGSKIETKILEGENQKEIMRGFNASYPNAILKEVCNHEPAWEEPYRPYKNYSNDKVREEHRRWKWKFARAKGNEETGIYLHSKMSEHNAEIHYMYAQYKTLEKELKTRNIKPLIEEVEL